MDLGFDTFDPSFNSGSYSHFYDNHFSESTEEIFQFNYDTMKNNFPPQEDFMDFQVPDAMTQNMKKRKAMGQVNLNSSIVPIVVENCKVALSKEDKFEKRRYVLKYVYIL